MDRVESIDRIVGSVHPVFPPAVRAYEMLLRKVIERSCDALDITVAGFLHTPEACAKLRGDVDGLIERLTVLSALILEREADLTGKV